MNPSARTARRRSGWTKSAGICLIRARKELFPDYRKKPRMKSIISAKTRLSRFCFFWNRANSSSVRGVGSSCASLRLFSSIIMLSFCILRSGIRLFSRSPSVMPFFPADKNIYARFSGMSVFSSEMQRPAAGTPAVCRTDLEKSRVVVYNTRGQSDIFRNLRRRRVSKHAGAVFGVLASPKPGTGKRRDHHAQNSCCPAGHGSDPVRAFCQYGQAQHSVTE